jgi:cobaltochelatase CobN
MYNENTISLTKSIGEYMPQSELIPPKQLMLAQISICDGCCCGKMEKGHPEVPVQWLKQEWKVRGLLKRVHLSISGCLGPCDVPNVVMITNSEGAQWLARLNGQRHFAMLADWAEQSRDADELLPLPKEFLGLALMPYRNQAPLASEGQR